MKIQRLSIDNFLRVGFIDLDISNDTAHLFAGENCCGKSSLAESIRFALTGETVRVSRKGDYKQMVKEGSKTGTVSVLVDGQRVSRDVKTAEQTTQPEYKPPAYLGYVLNAQRFAHEKPDIRRKMLFALTGTKVDRENIIKRLLVKGCDEALCEEVAPMLRSGLSAAHDAAEKRATTLRAQWTGLTGQSRYGRQIASDWKPEPPKDYDPERLIEVDGEALKITRRLSQLDTQKGATQQMITEAQAIIETMDSAKDYDPASLEAVKKDIETTTTYIDDLNEVIVKANQEIAQGSDKAPVTCCECGTQLKVSFVNRPGAGVTAEVSKFTPLSSKAMESLQGLLHKNATLLRAAKEKLIKYKKEAEELSKAAPDPALKAMARPDIDALSIQQSEIAQKIDALQQDQTALDIELRGLRESAGLVKGAADIEKRALEMHQAIEKWTKIKTELAPDGIPAEILTDALKPINDRLSATAAVTGWPLVVISPTIEVHAGARSYHLLSESAKWRADAAIAEAIAHLSGLKLLVLDRVDVLSIRNRGAFIMWMASIVQEYDTILAFATLKELPPRLPAGMAAHWIENGEIRPNEVAA